MFVRWKTGLQTVIVIVADVKLVTKYILYEDIRRLVLKLSNPSVSGYYSSNDINMLY